MKAIIVDKPGSPEVLQMREVPLPRPQQGWVRIRVKAFGLNRAEMFTRQGHSPSVIFPRILGIECVGIVDEAPGYEHLKGKTVAAVMGGMGRDFDGSYAEYTCVPESRVCPIVTQLDWPKLAAVPETYLTAWATLHGVLEIQANQTLLVRGGTSALGLASISLAKVNGVTVIATTRSSSKIQLMKERGADHVVIDTGEISEAVRQQWPEGVDRILELVGTTTLLDSLKAAHAKGIVCMAGVLGNQWTLNEFSPMAAIPSGVRLTSYHSDTLDMKAVPLQQIVEHVEKGRLPSNIDRVYRLDQITEAHRRMESSTARGKLVVVID